jgi:hypothetical protein
MRHVALAALLALSALAVPAAPAAAAIELDASHPATTEVDLAADAGETLVFRLDGHNFSAGGPIRSAAVRLAAQGEPPLEVAMAPAAGQNWTASLPVWTPDLVKGSWAVTYVVLRDSGTATLTGHRVDVIARDTASPQLALARPASPVIVGPGDSVQLTVRDPLLRRVTFEFGGLPPRPLPDPYALRGDALPEGRTEVTFKASDRAGHTTTLKVDVVRDTAAPELNLTLPDRVYVGVPFLAYARVTEAGPYTLRFAINGTAQPDAQVTGTVAPGIARSSAFTVTPEHAGNLSVSVAVTDQAGQVTLGGRILHVEPPITDLRLSRLAPAPGTQFAQRPVLLTATLEQEEGVATLPVPVVLSVGGRSFARVEEVAASGPRLLTWEVALPGGRHTARAVAEVPEDANETAPGDENATVQFEVFLGRVLHDGVAYVIRAGANGLPSSAVEEGREKSYPLEVVDAGKGVAYRFELAGNETVDWDPLDPLDESSAGNGTGSSTSTSTGGDGSRPAPGAAPLVALLLVAVAAWVQRRRL